MAKVPAVPPADLARREPVWREWATDGPFWRIADSAGAHPAGFAELRGYGPLRAARFDPHPEPASADSGERVGDAAATLLTALAERFQVGQELRRRDPGAPVAYAWRPTRAVRLLDLSGPGAVALGAAHAIGSYRKDVTRRWARALRDAFPQADGVLYGSSMTGEPCAALWAPSTDSFPGVPDFARALADPAPTWQRTLRAAAARLRYAYG